MSGLLLIAKAASYRPASNLSSTLPIMPDTQLVKDVRIKASHYQNYQTLCQWSAGIASVIHPSYVQVLSLPMQLAMMVEHPFPFKPLGLVHLSNTIDINFLPEQTANMRLQTYFTELKHHRRGWVFGICTQAYVNDALAINATSEYLARVKHQNMHEGIIDETHIQAYQSNTFDSDFDEDLSLDVPFERNIGRRYARVSGDYNPIHLSQYSAKLLGFKRAIAHGMYSKALCISKLFSASMHCKQQLLSPLQMSANFQQPLYLPANASLRAQLKGDASGMDYELCTQSTVKKRVHMNGSITFKQPL